MAKTRKKKSNKVIYILLGVFVVLIAVAVIFQKNKKKETEVEFTLAKRLTIVEKISASGMVQPVTEVKLSPDVAGEIIQLDVEEGDSVVQGQLLVRIRPDNYISAMERAEASLNTQKANHMSSRANLARAEATYERARLELERSEKLFNENVISSSEWELGQQSFKIADNDLKSARASVDAAGFVVKSSQAALDDANENLRKTTMYAPISGTVSKKSVLKGERVVGTSQFAGTEMLRLAAIMAMEAGIGICAPIHDAILIESSIDCIDEDIRQMQQIMLQAGEIVLNGFTIRSDVEKVVYPDRYMDEGGSKMWDLVMEVCNFDVKSAQVSPTSSIRPHFELFSPHTVR
jgi:HlyD family secretion protein